MFWDRQYDRRLGLIVRNGPLEGRTIAVSGDLILGRGRESSVRLIDPNLSRAHSSIRLKRSRLIIEDLGSNNGTYVNDKPVRKRRLRVGDRIRIGTTELEVLEGVREAPSRERPAPGAGNGQTTGKLDRVHTLVDFEPACLEAMNTGEFLAALGQTDEILGEDELDDDAIRGLQVRTRNFAVVYNLAQALQRPVRVDELLRTATGFIFKVIQAERCFVLLADPSSGELQPALARHRDPEIGEVPVQLSRSILDRVLTERRAVVSSDAIDDPQFVDDRRSILHMGLRSVLCVPILDGDELIGVIQLERSSSINAFSRGDFELMTIICSLLGSRIQSVRLFEEQERTIDRLREAQHALHVSRLDLVWKLAKAAELRDEETGNHIDRVAGYARAVATTLGLDRDVVEAIYVTAPLHDIGKIGIPDEILLKPGKLTPAEWEHMKQHCEIGARILREDSKAMADYLAWRGLKPDDLRRRGDPILEMACEIALTHHERWDGSGYPAGLAGEAIPLSGRIVAICDVFDALLSERPYKRAYSWTEAMARLEEGVGAHFDPRVHAAFMANLDEIEAIRARFSDTPPSFAAVASS